METKELVTVKEIKEALSNIDEDLEIKFLFYLNEDPFDFYKYEPGEQVTQRGNTICFYPKEQ